MVTALSIAGDLTFNPETDALKGSNGEHVLFLCIVNVTLPNNKNTHIRTQ